MPADLTPWLALSALAWIAWRVLLIWRFPFAPCRVCAGAARYRCGQYWRPCRRCRGTGRRVRLGRRIWHWATTSSNHP
ncbi:MAG: hypothetical protein ACRDTC_23525 [Pseudonocardiaceae bacterium]